MELGVSKLSPFRLTALRRNDFVTKGSPSFGRDVSTFMSNLSRL
jgi:hypothetical protein